ncbi:hypothetical protein ACP4OV_031093 [Aristida adscensionis]
MAAEHDLTPRLAAHLDRHLLFPLLEFLQQRRLYPEPEVLAAKLRLLAGTNMVEYAMDTHRSLHGADDVPADMAARRGEVLARLGELEAAAAPLVAVLRDTRLAQELRPDRKHNARVLQERFQIGPDQIEAFYNYAKYLYECGNYPDAVQYLYEYRVFCTKSERSVSALWGTLASEILNQNWDAALEELNRLKEIIDSENFSTPLNQLQNRTWLMHWSLFIFFNHENGRNGIIDLFFQDRYLNTIQTNAHHLLRYLATAVVVNKRRRNLLKDLIKVIQQERQCYKDPITEFLECLYVKYDFDGAQQKLMDCEQVILNDLFWESALKEEIPLLFLSEMSSLKMLDCLFLRPTAIYIVVWILGVLAEKMNMRYDEAELWIMNLVRNSKLDAKIDSASGTLIMVTDQANVHERMIESLKNLNMRTYMLAKNIVEPAQAAQQATLRD